MTYEVFLTLCLEPSTYAVLFARSLRRFCASAVRFRMTELRPAGNSVPLHMPQIPPVVLSIAGFDPCSGAGVTADIKTAAAHGCYAVACITALTIQSTRGARRVEPVGPE